MSSNLLELEKAMYAARDTSAMETLTEFAETKIALLSEHLSTCGLEEVRFTQGQIKALRDTLTALTKPPFDL